MSRVHYKSYEHIKSLARNLRQSPTDEESILWNLLKGRKLRGYKFLRQHPIIYRIVGNNPEFFIPDFYCSELKLVIELDGKIHDFKYKEDKMRDLKLESKGLFVKRIRNDEMADVKKVFSDLELTISEIENTLNKPVS